MANKASVSIGKHNVSVNGRFRLDVNRNKKKFTLTNINAFVPFGKTLKDKKQFLTQSGLVDSLIIDKIYVLFDPDQNEIHSQNVEVFIQHPDVRIGGMSHEDHDKLVKQNLKKGNPKFTITNIDRVDDENYDQGVELVEARYALMSKKNPLTIEKLVYITAALELSYRTHITDPARYKKFLIKNIDSLIQSDKEKREKFVELVENIAEAEYKYYISELQNLGIITEVGGIFKIGDRPVGASIDHIINFFEENSDLYEKQKDEVKRVNQNQMHG